MKHLLLGSLTLAVSALLTAGLAQAEVKPEFKLGFRALADQVPDVVGQPLESEHWGANGDSLQATSNGLMVWRKADNWTAFTNGWMTWLNGPNGVESRPNGELLPWETPIPTILPTSIPTSAPMSLPTATVQPTSAPAPVSSPTARPTQQRIYPAPLQPYQLPTPTVAPAPPMAWPTPIVGTVTMDGKQYLTNLGWNAQGFDDPYLRAALAYAYNYNPEWRQNADMAALLKTTVRWGPLPLDINGRFTPSENRITINSALRNEYTGAVAAVLAHETYHAALGTSPAPLYCLQTEVNAFSWQAGTWAGVPRPATPRTALERDNDSVMRAWQAHSLSDLVVTLPGYQQQCLGGELKNP